MRGSLALAGAVALTLATSRQAHAWEGVCRSVDAPFTSNRTVGDYVTSICQLANTDNDSTLCQGAFDYPRNFTLGEHGWLAYIGLRWAGLESYAKLQLPPYYIDGQDAFPSLLSMVPAGLGATTKQSITRNAVLSDLAEISDNSYSLSDWLMGNEHCLPQNIARASQSDIAACHTYNSHVAIVNSTHFAPQNQHVYWLYHELALERAVRCKAVKQALDAAPPPWLEAADESRYVQACELEALALQAVASHFLQDAWSTGHMWQRWGSPIFPPGDASQQEAIVAGMVSGLIHGWRSIARDTWPLQGMQHDQLCMPGSFWPSAPGLAVRFTQPSLGGTLFGGGDLYLLACTAQQPAFQPSGPPGWAVAPGPLESPASEGLGTDDGSRPLSPQYKRMMTCNTLGFREVYTAGPATGNLPLGVPASQFQAGIDTSLSSACWEARVTDTSMLLGAGVNAESFRTAGFWGRTVVDTIPYIAADHGDPGKVAKIADSIAGLFGGIAGRQLRADLVTLYDALAEVNATSANGVLAADLPGARLAQFRGNPRNSDSVGLIDTERVGYLEPHAAKPPDPMTPVTSIPNAWHSVHTGSCGPGTGDVNGDTRCPDGYYCDRAVAIGEGVTPGRSCVRHETAILRAFRDGELATWCGDDTVPDLDAARTACVSATDPDGKLAACNACSTAVAVHARFAGDAHDFGRRTALHVGDPRSVCDVLKSGKALVDPTFDPATNAVYAATNSVAARNPPGWKYEPWGAASALCESDNPLPTDATTSASLPQTLSGGYFTCARGCGSRLWCWGAGAFPGLGYGFGATPLFVNLADIASVSVGADYACAIASNQVYCWGDDNWGQLGPGTTEASADPVLVPGLAGATVVSAGGLGGASDTQQVCAVVGGKLWCWGGNYGTKPLAVAMPGAVSIVDAASAHAATSGGTVYAWDPLQPTTPPSSPVYVSWDAATNPISGTPLAGVTQLAGGCGLAGMQVYCFMNSPYPGPWWSASTTSSIQWLIPLTLPDAAVAISGAYGHMCALLATNGQVACWGSESHGEIGDGQTAASNIMPVTVPSFTGAIAIAAGFDNTCAMKQDGTVWCWGAATDLGAGPKAVDSTVPVEVSLACP